MARTRKRTRLRFSVSAVRAVSVTFLALLLLPSPGAQANNSSSESVVSSEELTADDVSAVETGMKPFFDMVKSFLEIVQPHKISDQTWLNLSRIYENNRLQTDQFQEWKNWVTYLIGFVVCAAIGVLFFLVMPITGLIFCCCRCAGKCGGKRKPHDPKRAGCKRRSYCTMLLLLNTITLAGVVCAFLANEVVYSKLRNENQQGVTGNFLATLQLVDRFSNETADSITDSTLTRFLRVKDDIISDVRNTANEAVQEVLSNLNATHLLDKTRELSRDVNNTRDALMNVEQQLSTLSDNATELTQTLSQIATDISTTCSQTSLNICGGFNSSDYKVSPDFSKLNKLSNESGNVANSVDIGKYIKQAEDNIDATKNSTTSNVDDGINDATASVNKVESEIQKGVDDMKAQLKTSVTDQTAMIRHDLTDTQKEIAKYGKYWWYGGLGVSSVLLLVVVLYYVGVLFGLCGERPGLGAQCCNTGTGANFLMAGVTFTFLLAWLLMLVVVLLFVTGGPLYTELCRYFVDHNPRELQPFSDAIIKAADFEERLYHKKINLNLANILKGCQGNQAIYRVMQLDNMVNLTQYTDLSEFRHQLDQLKNKSFNIPPITIVTASLNTSVERFASAGLDNINFTEYYAEINKNLTSVDLSQLATNIRNIAMQSTADNTFREFMMNKSRELDTLKSTLVADMKASVASLNTSLRFLQHQVETQIEPKTRALLEGLQSAETNFNQKKDQLVRTQLYSVIDRVLNKAENYISGMLADVNENIGQCRPVYDAFYHATDAVCVVALEPLNAFWFSVGWCLFFFIPCLIFAVKLAGLYRREHDEKDFDDPNYILYSGHQDTIPLTSVERGVPSAYPGTSGGMSNSAYQRDSYMGPHDKYAPPPYGAPHSGMGSADMNGSHHEAGPKSINGYYPY